MSAYTRVEAYAINNRPGIEPFHLGVSVELVEVAHTEGEVSVSEELYGFGFLSPHEQCGDVGLFGALLKQSGKGSGSLFEYVKVC